MSQGSVPMLAPGAPRTDGVHPFRKTPREPRTGDTVVAGPRTTARCPGTRT